MRSNETISRTKSLKKSPKRILLHTVNRWKSDGYVFLKPEVVFKNDFLKNKID
jgi:hypothetical protein